MAARSAKPSSGKSRKMSLALPVSIQFSLTLGSVSRSKAAQWGQVREAYSNMVMGASALPRTRSSGVCWGVCSWASAGGAPPRIGALRISAARNNQILRISLSKLLDVDATACGAPMQAAVIKSVSLPVGADHRLAQALQRGAKRGILYVGEPPVKLLTLGRAQRPRPRRRRGGPLDRALLEHESRHRAIAEEGVDAFEEHGLAMLDLGGERRSDAEMKRAVAPLAPGKGELLRHRAFGDILADDGGPVCYELRLGEAALAEHGPGDARHLRGNGAHRAAPLLLRHALLLSAVMVLPCHARSLHPCRR